MSNLVGSVWESKKGMAPVEVVADPTPASPMRWLLVRGAGGRQRHITLDGLTRKYVRREVSADD